MKPLTELDKEWIRARIEHATGQPFGEVRPEFFISATSGVKLVDVDNTKGPFPHLVTLAINPAGQFVEFGIAGCN